MREGSGWREREKTEKRNCWRWWWRATKKKENENASSSLPQYNSCIVFRHLAIRHWFVLRRPKNNKHQQQMTTTASDNSSACLAFLIYTLHAINGIAEKSGSQERERGREWVHTIQFDCCREWQAFRAKSTILFDFYSAHETTNQLQSQWRMFRRIVSFRNEVRTNCKMISLECPK